jgi:hypothetical protein
MTASRTFINCPQCGKQVVAEIEQVFDVGSDPASKQRFLSGQYNIVQCPHCRFNGNISTPVVYHDPEKELLLNFLPSELNLPMPEQEKAIGALIQQVVDALPPEQRKGYIFSPQRVFTMQGLVERILEEDGITKEVIQAQQKIIELIQRLANITDETALEHVVKEEDEKIDAEFFALMNQLIEGSAARGDSEFAKNLIELQQKLIPITSYGKEMQEKAAEVEEAVKTLNELGENISRDKLLDVIIAAPNETRVDAFVSLARGAMDYQFFQMLSDKIEAAEGDEKEKLTSLREQLLKSVDEIDKAIQARLDIAKQNIDRILSVDNMKEIVMANLNAIDEFFMQALALELAEAEKNEDKDRLDKLNSILEVLNEAAESAKATQVDVELIQELIEADDENRAKLFEERKVDITPKLIEGLTGAMMQVENAEGQEELAEKLRAVYKDAIKISMQNMKDS